MTGHRANTAPAAALSSARAAGSFHTVTDRIRPVASPARDACQAGRRTTPSSTSTTTIGRAATTKDRARLSPTGVRSW